jgi:hypothetical protein
VWNYEVSGKQVLLQWFSYRKADRERPIIGDRRTPSPLADIQPKHWLPEYTTELINVLNVLVLLSVWSPRRPRCSKNCSDTLISGNDLRSAGALELPAQSKQSTEAPSGPDLFDHAEPK